MGRVRRALAVWCSTLFVLSCAVACGDSSSSTETSSRPNILLLVTDDQRWDSMHELPQMYRQPEWARFQNAFVNDPQCCPSRSTIFTGRYTQHTHVERLDQGANLDESRTTATMLRKAGYHTGFYGKYLNGFPFKGTRQVPPGWDEFEANTGRIGYDDYTLIENGEKQHYGPETYPTDLLTQKALEFLDRAKRSKPFFLEVAYNAPHSTDHGPPEPAARDVGSCASEAFAPPPNFNATDTRRTPAWLQPQKPQRPASMTRWRKDTCETLRAVDRSVVTLVEALAKSGRLRNTYVVFVSDNGFAFGEHRLFGKGHLYEESIRVPLWVRGPDVQPGAVERLTSNVDLAPTFLDWADVAPPKDFFDGHSFARTLRGEPDYVPKDVLLRGCMTTREQLHAGCGAYTTGMGLNWGLRTARYKYIENEHDLQLYDLRADPYELTNLAYDAKYQPVVRELAARLRELRK